MIHFARTSSIEAIAGGWSPKTAQWYGRDHARMRPEDAAMALSGIEQPALAFWLWAMGHRDPGHAAIMDGYLRDRWGAEGWPESRLAGMIRLCCEELSRGYASESDAKLRPVARARQAGMHRSTFKLVWKARYERLMASALDQVSAASAIIGPRVMD